MIGRMKQHPMDMPPYKWSLPVMFAVAVIAGSIYRRWDFLIFVAWLAGAIAVIAVIAVFSREWTDRSRQRQGPKD
jgi:uncharacterized membrane protein YcjF (UPF0283 family)